MSEDKPSAPSRSQLQVNSNTPIRVGRRDVYLVHEQAPESMNQVHFGKAKSSGKFVVIKEAQINNADTQRAFASERHNLSLIDHPDLVSIIDTSETPETRFMVVSYQEGETLAELINQKKVLSPQQSYKILSTVSNALMAIHGIGAVHRDIKPKNIIVRPDGTGALIDLGLMQSRDKTYDLRAHGEAVGTPQYMSPELCKGSKRIDARADIYSLGHVLYEMVTGKPMYTAAEKGQVMRQHILLPSRHAQTSHACVPKAVDDVIIQATRKAPNQRYGRVKLFIEALETASQASYNCSCNPLKIYKKGVDSEAKTLIMRAQLVPYLFAIYNRLLARTKNPLVLRKVYKISPPY